MTEIHEPGTDFPFNKLILCPPTIVSSGNYFIKFKYEDGPLYIQCPKCTTKQGIVKAGKKYFCDLLLSNENHEFIEWIENLENYSQEVIYKNREKWFEAGLEKHDIENSFLSTLKTFKSGKFYTARTNAPSILGKCTLKIYDEEENDVDMTAIKDTTQIISILEIQGIKCSSRSFQIEFELKQMMVIKPSKLFEKCIIKTRSEAIPEANHTSSPPQRTENIMMKTTPVFELDADDDDDARETDENKDDVLDKPVEVENTTILDETVKTPPLANAALSTTKPPLVRSGKPEIKVSGAAKPDSGEIEEVDLDLAEIPESETVQLKNRNEVYYQMYRDARRNAKIAKDLALSAYLEAKRIKNTYMLTDLDDSDESDIENGMEQ